MAVGRVDGLFPEGPVVLHEYRTIEVADNTQFVGRTWIDQIRCSGQWYAVGTSPCEMFNFDQLADLMDVPECEVADDDLRAAAILLNLPRVSRCHAKGRASWTK